MLNTSEPKTPKKRPAAFALPFYERLDRAQAKRQAVIEFLASGELYTTAPMIEMFLEISKRSALRLVKAMTDDGILKVDETSAPAKLYGLSSHGLALAKSPHPRARAFELGRTAERMVNHHLECQRVRIGYMDSLALAKKCYWIPGYVLFGNEMMKKVPDAMFVDRVKNRKTAIEIELHVKSAERMAQVVSNHLRDIKNGHYSDVVYHTPHTEALERVLGRALRANASLLSSTLESINEIPVKKYAPFASFSEAKKYYDGVLGSPDDNLDIENDDMENGGGIYDRAGEVLEELDDLRAGRLRIGRENASELEEKFIAYVGFHRDDKAKAAAAAATAAIATNFSAATLFTIRDLPTKISRARLAFAEKNASQKSTSETSIFRKIPFDDHSIFDRLEDYDDE